MKDYYAVLHVKQSDDIDTIKQSYRKLAKQNHPDLHPGDKAAEERFKEIGEAWDTLGNEDKKKEYDQLLHAQSQNQKRTSSSQRRASAHPSAAPRSGGASYDDIMSKFGSFFDEDQIARMSEEQKGTKPAKNPIDTSAMFEKFMGFKK